MRWVPAVWLFHCLKVAVVPAEVILCGWLFVVLCKSSISIIQQQWLRFSLLLFCFSFKGDPDQPNRPICLKVGYQYLLCLYTLWLEVRSTQAVSEACLGLKLTALLAVVTLCLLLKGESRRPCSSTWRSGLRICSVYPLWPKVTSKSTVIARALFDRKCDSKYQ